MADVLPLVTAAISFGLAAWIAQRYVVKRRRQNLVWAASFALLGLAAVLAFLGNPDVAGWSPALYRAYLPLTALPVGLLGWGVLLLFRDRPLWGRGFGMYWAATSLLILAVCALAPLRDPDLLPAEGPTVGGRYLPLFGAVSWLQTVPGAVIFIGGGVYSWWTDRARRYGLFFALAGVLFSIAGFTSRLGAPYLLFPVMALAAVATFIGFAMALEFTKAARPEPAKA